MPPPTRGKSRPWIVQPKGCTPARSGGCGPRSGRSVWDRRGNAGDGSQRVVVVEVRLVESGPERALEASSRLSLLLLLLTTDACMRSVFHAVGCFGRLNHTEVGKQRGVKQEGALLGHPSSRMDVETRPRIGSSPLLCLVSDLRPGYHHHHRSRLA